MERGERIVRFLKAEATFFRIHALYFLVLTFISSGIFWAIGARGQRRFPFIDCLYTVSSALYVTGLSSIQIEDVPAGGQVLLMLMMVFGGQVLTSLAPLFVKKRRYCQVARTAMQLRRAEKQRRLGTLSPEFSRSEPEKRSSVLRRVSSTFKLQTNDDEWMAKMATKKKAEHLREVFQEYEATVALIWLVLGYHFMVHLVGFFIAWGSILYSDHSRRVLDGKQVNKGFFALFATFSAFENAGFILADENLVPFNKSTVLLLDLAALILLGNTMYPLALRGAIWLMHRLCKGRRKETLRFLLAHPRRCYTHLFPQRTSLWLLVAVTGITGFECIMFYILDWHSTALKSLSPLPRLVNGYFQSVNTRSSGMNSVNISELSAAILFLYCGAMYLAAYPVFLSRQYSGDHETEDEPALVPALAQAKHRDMQDTTIASQSKRLLAKDWTVLFILTFIICIAEGENLRKDPGNYSVFPIIFEVMSAYGNVGLSLGYRCSLRLAPGPCQDMAVSFSGMWCPIGKLLIILVMFLGRHRGLPDNIDSAIVLPDTKFINFLRRPSQEEVQSQELAAVAPPRSESTDI